MRLEMQGQMRMEQRMKLAPHMIQSMEILQLSILALQERIEQELSSNPVLEIDEPRTDEKIDRQPPAAESEQPQGFEQFENIDDSYREYINKSAPFRRKADTEAIDGKLEAIKNTAAHPQSLHEYLSQQWGLIDADESVKKAGVAIIDYINDKGYLTVRLEQLHNKDKTDFSFGDLKKALELIQTLEPLGVGARDLKECLLIQMAQSISDMSFEQELISKYMGDLLDNRLPDIAKKMNCSIENVSGAIERMSKLDTSPGLQIGKTQNHPISADVIVEQSDDMGDYSVRLTDFRYHSLKISNYYANMTKDSSINKKTKSFLQSNICSAQWIIDAIEQRKNTLLKVTLAVVKHQKEFFDKGQLHLKPLPMSRIADEVGVHLATVSRAVSGKYIQCSWGIIPLRKFFSGGTKDVNGQEHSWEAIRAKLQQIIDVEDKSKPLSDDKIRKELAVQGIENLARRTIAKYRKILNIPSARYRKKY